MRSREAMGDRGYRAGLAQILVEGGHPDANLARAEAAIGRAARIASRASIESHPWSSRMANAIDGG